MAQARNPLRVAPFRWTVGALCAVFGALMLVEPHQFGAAVYHVIQPHLPLWGAGFLIAGAALLCVAAIVPRTIVDLLVHAAAGGVLLLLGVGFAESRTWSGVAVYGAVGLGTILAAVLPRIGQGSWGRGDLLAVVTGTSGLTIGLLMLLAPGQFAAPNYDSIRSDLAWYGAAFVASSLSLITVEIYPVRSQLIKRCAHMFAGAAFLVFMVEVVWPNPTGVALYGGFGLAVGLQPWLAGRLPAIDRSSLRARSALLLVAIAALPLIGAVAIVADRAGELARGQALAQQQTLAVALAADADDYIGLHRAAASGLATVPGLLDLPPDVRHSVLRDFSTAYPDVVAFSIFGADGSPLGRSDDLRTTSAAGSTIYEDARRSGKPSIDVLLSSLIHRPVFAFGAPIRSADGQFGGLIAVALESTRIAAQITQASGDKDMLAYLVDAHGRVVAHPDTALVESFADLSATAPVAAFLSAQAPDGTLTYSNAGGQQLVGYAKLPDLGWGVIVERPEAVALASVRTAREIAFDVLLAFIALAVIVAVVSTRWLTRPLAVLADAAQRLSIGDYAAPLPTSRLTEIARLAAVFGQMRADVLSRTAERDQAGVEVLHSEARLRQLLDGVPVGIFVIDSRGQPYYENPVAEQLFGRSLLKTGRLSSTAQPYNTYVAGTDDLYPLHRLPTVLALAGVSVSADDLEVLRPTGERIRLHVQSSPIFDATGAVEFAMSAFTDMSERRQFEADLMQARDEALEASRAKSRFLAMMSHEIRTPMNGVIGMSSLLIDTDLTDRQYEYADAVRRSGEALLTIINDILDFSKIEAGKLEVELGAVDVQQAVEEVVELLAEQAHSKGLELATLGDPQVPLGLLGDAGRIRQVLLNLVGNAVKFTEYGEVVVRTKLIEHTPTAATVRFEVVDTGIGISQETAAQLFQPFSQADSSTTRKHGGTGLGLAICKGLVERMGGAIGLDTEPGRGSTFWFTVCLRGPASAMLPRMPIATLDGLRVLAVDDNATNRTILQQHLVSGGLSVDTAVDGSSALERLRSAALDGSPFAIAVLDMHMPGMDGLELATAIRADSALSDTPLVLLSSVGDQGRADLFAAVLTKPARQSHLLATLASVLGGQASTEAPRRQATVSVPMGPGPRILVAEDTGVNQLVARRMLEKLGCRVDIVSNGREAVAAFEANSYDLVFMDVRMPEMDGFAATTAIRQRERDGSGHTPIVAMTANALEGDQESCLAAGMDDYVSKPVRLPELEAVVRRWVTLVDGESVAA